MAKKGRGEVGRRVGKWEGRARYYQRGYTCGKKQCRRAPLCDGGRLKFERIEA